MAGRLWRVSDCEELVGGYSQEMMGFVLGFILRIRLPTDAVLFQKSHYPKVIVPLRLMKKCNLGRDQKLELLLDRLLQ